MLEDSYSERKEFLLMLLNKMYDKKKISQKDKSGIKMCINWIENYRL